MKKSVKVFILVLILIIIGLVAYIIVDKVVNKDDSEEETNIVTNSTTTNESDNKESKSTEEKEEIQKSDFYGDWNNDEDTELTINNDGTFQADHYTAASTIYGDYTINGNKIEFVCKKNDETYNKKWNGTLKKDKDGNYELKVNLYDEETTLKKDTTTVGINDYQNYVGTWANDVTNADEFIIKSIENGKITFTWVFYRLGSIDDQTLNLNGNKCEFYYETYSDYTEKEKVTRRGTIELKDNMVYTKIVDVEKVDDNAEKIEFLPGEYVGTGVREYKVKMRQ